MEEVLGLGWIGGGGGGGLVPYTGITWYVSHVALNTA